MKRQEYMRKVYQKITRYLKPASRQSINKVHITTEDGELQIPTTKAPIKSILLDHHKQHFSQAQGTPFTVNPFSTNFQHMHQPSIDPISDTTYTTELPTLPAELEAFLDPPQ